MFFYEPDGKKDNLQLIPISEVDAKDDVLNIIYSSRDDMLASHRVPPQLIWILRDNTGCFGDVKKAAMVLRVMRSPPCRAT